MPTFAATMLRILDENGISYSPELIHKITPLGIHGTAAYFITLGVPLTQEQIIGLMKQYLMEAYLQDIPAKKHVATMLRQLKSKGYRLNILTASPHVSLDPCLKRLGLYELFDHVWSCDDFGRTKSDVAIYRAVADRLQTDPSQILFFDDNCNACQTAKAAGLSVCGVYDPTSEGDADAIRQFADRYIIDFSELLDLCE